MSGFLYKQDINPLFQAFISGVPNSRPQMGTGLWPYRNWATQQEVSGGQAREASSVFTSLFTTPHRSPYCLSAASCQISGTLLILHYGELYNYFIIYHNVIIIEIKCTM